MFTRAGGNNPAGVLNSIDASFQMRLQELEEKQEVCGLYMVLLWFNYFVLGSLLLSQILSLRKRERAVKLNHNVSGVEKFWSSSSGQVDFLAGLVNFVKFICSVGKDPGESSSNKIIN